MQMAEEEEKGADLLNDAGKLLRRKFEKKYRVLLDEKWLKSCLDFIAAGQEGGGASTDGSAHVEGQVLVQVLHSNLADSTATKSHSSAADSAVPRPLTPCLLQIEEIMEIGSSALSLLHLIQDSRQKRAISKQGSSSILLGSSFSEEKVSSEIVNFPRKMLALVLSNGAGQLRFSAIERKLCPQLSITMPLGTKVKQNGHIHSNSGCCCVAQYIFPLLYI